MKLDELIAMPGALAWVICYILILRRAHLDKAYGMPLVALAVNFAWEFIFGFVDPDAPPMDTVNKVWWLVDVALVYQMVRFGRAEFEARWPKGSFLPVMVLTFVLGFGVVYGVHMEFDDSDGRYTGFGDNLMMSALFIMMLHRRCSSAGQSVWIALSKMAGTGILSVAQGIKTPSWPMVDDGRPLMFVLYVGCFLLDGAYVWLLVRQLRAEGKNPWTRF